MKWGGSAQLQYQHPVLFDPFLSRPAPVRVARESSAAALLPSHPSDSSLTEDEGKSGSLPRGAATPKQVHTAETVFEKPPSYPVSAPSVTTRSLWQLLAKSTARTLSGFASNRLVTLCHRLLFHRPLFYFLSKMQELQPFCIFSRCLIVRWSRPVLSRSTLHWPRDCFGTMPLLSSVPLVSVL